MNKRNRRGNAIVVGLSLVTLLGFGALAIDIAAIRVARAQLQAACDVAAISGAGYLDGTQDGITDAIQGAVVIAAENQVLGSSVALSSGNIEVGVFEDGVFTTWDGDDPDVVNALRIEHAAPNAVPALGAVAFGATGYQVTAEALAQRPAGTKRAASANCFLPIAIPDCHLDNVPAGQNPAPFKFKFTNSSIDTVAWGDPDANPNSNALRDQLLGQCDGGDIELGDPIWVNEGQHNSAMHTIRDILNDKESLAPGTWDGALFGPIPARPSGSEVLAAEYGNVLEGPVALVDAGGNCNSLQFVHSKPLTGIAWAVIYDVNSKGGDKYVSVQLDLVRDHTIWAETDDSATGPNVFGVGAPALASGQ